MIEQTIGDAECLVQEDLHEEQESQDAYQTLIQDTSKTLSKDEAEKSLEYTTKELQDLEVYAATGHTTGDFVL